MNSKAAEPEVAPLTGHHDSAWLGPEPRVLCLGVRTPLDTAAAAMLAQALRQAGLSAQAAAATQLSEIDLSRVKLVWLSSLDAAHSNAHIRYSVRRLRRSAPDLVFGGAFWDGHDVKALLEQAHIALVASTVESAVQSTIERSRIAQCAAGQKDARDDYPSVPVTASLASR